MAVETKVLQVEGMSCMHCVNAIQKALGALPGVKKADVDLNGKTVKVEYDGDAVALDAMKEAIQDAGYQVV